MDISFNITIPDNLLQRRAILADEFDKSRPATRIQFEQLCDAQADISDIVQEAWIEALVEDELK